MKYIEDSKTTLGFWIYLMTDCVIFASLFATFAVLRDSTFGGPQGHDIFSLPLVLVQTLLLLTSSFLCGVMVLFARQKKQPHTQLLLLVTLLLGAAFVALEINEFSQLIHEGYSWQRSAFLSAFFTLVGTHGLHITIGLIWAGFLFVKIASSGLNHITIKRLFLFSLFWHFLDVVWIFIFTFVYLMGIAL